MEEKFKYQSKYNRGIYFTFFGIVIGLVTLVAISSYLLYQREKDQTALELGLEAQKSLDIMEQFIGNEFNFVGKDLLYLSNNPAFASYLSDKKKINRVAIEKTLTSFGQIRDHYYTIRLIDTLGFERLKIEFINETPHINTALQDKSNRYYFWESKGLKKGEIYISALDLNIENGNVSKPTTPVFRFISPFFNQKGKKMGSVVISYKADRILDRIPLVENKYSLAFIIASPNGKWIKGPPSDFSFSNNDSLEYTHSLQTSYPNIWNKIKTNKEGNSIGKLGFTYYRTLDSRAFFDGMRIIDSSPINWYLLSSFPKGHLTQLLWGIRRDLILYGLLMLGLIIPTIALLFQNLLEKNNSINRIALDLEQTNRSLFRNDLELQHNLVQLEELTQEKEQVIEELEVKERELIIARDRAEEATEAKSNFLATMSHEIRTPLNAVLGMTDLLSRSKLNDDQIDLVKTIRISGDALLTVINDVLDFSRIQSGKMIINSHPFEIEKVINDTFEIVVNKIGEKDIELIYQIENSAKEIVLGDESRLRQVLLNLVGNAVKFTDSGYVFVRVSDEAEAEGLPGNLLFSIEDTGIGVPEDKQNLLFQPFNQIDSSITRKHGGSGLGLAISRKLVNNMGGEFKLKSIPNQGSCFQFSIFLEPQLIQPVDSNKIELDGKKVGLGLLSELHQKIISQLLERNGVEIIEDTFASAEVLIWDYHFKDALPSKLSKDLRIAFLNCPKEMQFNSNTHQLYLPQPLDQRNLLRSISSFEKIAAMKSIGQKENDLSLGANTVKILIAEDNAINMKLAVLILQKMGYEPVCVENGVKAISAFEKELFDIVLMDIQMPEMDGIEATRRIRMWFGKRPIIIALTANAMEGDRELYLKEGMDDYIAKPIQFELLQKKLKHWIKESRIRNGLSE